MCNILIITRNIFFLYLTSRKAYFDTDIIKQEPSDKKKLITFEDIHFSERLTNFTLQI